jgi:hypothetical protein
MMRHLVCNVRVFSEDERHARMLGLMSLYRADGKSPFQGSRPPAMIADFDAQCVLGDDGFWRFQSHVLRPFIVSGDRQGPWAAIPPGGRAIAPVAILIALECQPPAAMPPSTAGSTRARRSSE